MLSSDNESRARDHGENIKDEEYVIETGWNCKVNMSVKSNGCRVIARTVSVIVEIQQLIPPLSNNPKSILQECHDYEEAADRWQVSEGEKHKSAG